MTVVGEAGDGVEALALIKEQLARCRSTGLADARMDGLAVVAEVKASSLPIESNHHDDVRIRSGRLSLRESPACADICQKTPLWRKFSTPSGG